MITACFMLQGELLPTFPCYYHDSVRADLQLGRTMVSSQRLGSRPQCSQCNSCNPPDQPGRCCVDEGGNKRKPQSPYQAVAERSNSSNVACCDWTGPRLQYGTNNNGRGVGHATADPVGNVMAQMGSVPKNFESQSWHLHGATTPRPDGGPSLTSPPARMQRP